jgi:MYXO-CTERM domain-containing protein
MKPMAKRTVRLLSIPAGMALLCASFSARADQAADAWNTWNKAFLVQANSQTYYSGNPVTESPLSNPGGWTGALTIEVAEDAYQRNHTATQRQLVQNLVSTFLKDSGSTSADWCATVYNGGWKDGWNDDLGWMITAVLHGYQITGTADFLTVAQQTWDCAYTRGWDKKYSGGGIWELMDSAGSPSFKQPSKCTLSNDPFIIWGIVLYQITGQSSYLTEAEGIYSWVRDKFLDTNTGKVHECWAFNNANDTTGYLQGTSDNVYDDGTFLQSAVALYRVTGNNSYYQDALLVLKNRTSSSSILSCGCEGTGTEWAYPFVKGLGDFVNFNGLWQNYQTWMQDNANSAWSNRNTLNITWNDWNKPTPVYPSNTSGSNNQLSPLDTRGAEGIWQFFPQPLDPALTGAFELKNLGSNLSLTTSGANGGGAAVVQEPFGNSNESLWTFVPTNGGYYRIQNVSSGLFLTVESNSGAAGAHIVASPVTPAQGNEQWLPVLNSDGSYSFYNLSSILALDVPTQSTSSGTQLDQSFGNATTAQSFQLVPHTAAAQDAGEVTTSSDSGAGAVADGGDDSGGAVATGPDGSDVAFPPKLDAGDAGGSPDGAHGCGCKTAGARASSGLGGLAFFALGFVMAIRRRRLGRTNASTR